MNMRYLWTSQFFSCTEKKLLQHKYGYMRIQSDFNLFFLLLCNKLSFYIKKSNEILKVITKCSFLFLKHAKLVCPLKQSFLPFSSLQSWLHVHNEVIGPERGLQNCVIHCRELFITIFEQLFNYWWRFTRTLLICTINSGDIFEAVHMPLDYVHSG